MKHQHRLSWLGGIIFVVLAFCVSACSNTSTTTTSNAAGTPQRTGTTPTSSIVQNQLMSDVPSSRSTYSQSTVLPTLPLLQIYMTDAMHGWALDKNDVLKTSDGGKSWVVLTPRGVTLTSSSAVKFMSARYAWFTVPDTHGTTTIFSTTTGGASWKSSTIHESAQSAPDGVSLTFVSNQTGWFEVSPGGADNEHVDIFRTDNGGATWNKISTSGQGPNVLPNDGIKSGLSFINAETGWATGASVAMVPWLYITHDGGRTWRQQSIAGANDVNGGYAIEPPFILGNNAYLPMSLPYRPSNSPHTVLARSTDGGAHWTIKRQQLAPFTSDNVYVLNTQTAWGTDFNWTDVYQTTNGGKSWQKIASRTGFYGPLSFINTTTGFSPGPWPQPVIKRTDDGGKTWKTIVYQIHSA